MHLLGLYFFTRGFLLTRISSEDSSPAYDAAHPAPFEASHKKAILIVMDALRADFVIPHGPQEPFTEINFHNVLTLPAELTKSHPDHSLIFNAYADPPTATMQRIKGFTTGSLPTFIDVGSNFASSSIAEDSIISQLKNAGFRLGFAGDDTWANLFPNAFERDMFWPMDSFNVEDLHSVDEGVTEKLLPLLSPSNASRWDILIGHFLGVDHVGHRVGPATPTMRTKLLQMNTFLRNTVDGMDDETLLIVMGDHGMDDRGDHGGEGLKETASALWMYSKGPPLTAIVGNEAFINELPVAAVPESTTPFRAVNQVDLVPTLALQLGVPIPFNNMGSVIPEIFLAGAEGAQRYNRLHLAMQANGKQIMRYIDEYPGQLDRVGLHAAWQVAQEATFEVDELPSAAPVAKQDDRARAPIAGLKDRIFGNKQKQASRPAQAAKETPYSDLRLRSYRAHRAFAEETLAHVRMLWAQFSMTDMIIGLVILGLSLPTIWSFYLGIKSTRTGWPIFVTEAFEIAVSAGALVGSVIGTVRGAYTRDPAAALLSAAAAGIIASEVAIIAPLLSRMGKTIYATYIGRPQLLVMLGPGIMLLHSVLFAGNSFIIWEDRLVVFYATTLAVAPLVKAMTAPMHRLRIRIVAFCLGTATLIRLLGISSICREEQQPYCSVTFYAGRTIAVAPDAVRYSVLLMAWYIPVALNYVLSASKSNSGPAPIFLQGLRAVLVGGAAYWLLEFSETWEGLNPERVPLVKAAKAWLARMVMGIILGAGTYLWTSMPLCIEVKRQVVVNEQDKLLREQIPGSSPVQQEPEVTVLGFANSYGSTYLLFVMIPFALLFLLNLSSGQIAMTVLLAIIICHLELGDSQREAISMQRSFASITAPAEFDATTLPQEQPSFTEIAQMALLGHVGFFATGHQAVLASIQWKIAFVGFAEVSYPFSPLMVILNTWAPYILTALATPLLASWNVSPNPNGTNPVLADAMLSSLGYMMYTTALTVTSAATGALLRRHLMVWKVFAPRYMLAGATLVIVDLVMILAIGVGLARTSGKIQQTFRTVTM